LLVPAGVALLVGWRMYRRVKRMIGRQRLSNVRPWMTVSLFPILLMFLLAGAIREPMAAVALVAGVAIGSALGVYGLRLTQFEVTPLGLFYTPNAHHGIGLSLLLFARIAYRAVEMYLSGGMIREGSMAIVRSPLTLVIVGTLAGYYIAYAAGLLRWRYRVST
jgi:hypothetical protein